MTRSDVVEAALLNPLHILGREVFASTGIVQPARCGVERRWNSLPTNSQDRGTMWIRHPAWATGTEWTVCPRCHEDWKAEWEGKEGASL